jgi:hypothetical protein
MCDPVTLTAVAVATTAAGTGANMMAQSNARKAQQATSNANTARQAGAFDERMQLAGASDQRVMGIEQKQYQQTSDLENNTFATLLKYAQDHADDNALEDKGLVTAQRQLNNQAIQTKTLEAANQSGYLQKMTQQVADAVSSAMPGSQAAMTTANFAQRMKLMGTALAANPGAAPSLTADDLVKQAYAARQDAANATIAKEAQAGSFVNATKNSASWADQLLSQGAQSANLTANRAALSKSLEGNELASNTASDQLAQAHASFAKGLNDWTLGQKNAAENTYSGQAGQTLSDYFDRSLQSEKDYSSGLIGANTAADATDTALANYKVGNTTANTNIGDALLTAGKLAAAGAGAVGGADTPIPVKTLPKGTPVFNFTNPSASFVPLPSSYAYGG